MSGSPAPAAKWLRNGKEVTPGAFLHGQHNNLAFAAVTMSDAGTYTCTAEAARGPVTSASYTLDVLGKNRPNNGGDDVTLGRRVNLSAAPPQSQFLS